MRISKSAPSRENEQRKYFEKILDRIDLDIKNMKGASCMDDGSIIRLKKQMIIKITSTI